MTVVGCSSWQRVFPRCYKYIKGIIYTFKALVSLTMLSAGRGSLCATGYCRSRCLWGQAVPVVTGEALLLLLLLMRLPCSGVRSVTAAAGGAAAQQPVTYHMSVALCHVILIRPCWVRVRVWVHGCVCEWWEKEGRTSVDLTMYVCASSCHERSKT